ncbi:cell wall-binding repeat-containing protein [Salinibacterium soli]|uniref:Cell wall-binding repeat-containing protein n=1 Tax=Antiquaquibacter soli TaxID=3064523 RepID=A0ABT9BJC3_9MICO|nr:cell wall-binding repeat-containing protein [Protaetiibacter sp. WY-16]MDO7881116.1 cell wall-binding repeat-containing protein [Protaetiibacter sp. WY-16]
MSIIMRSCAAGAAVLLSAGLLSAPAIAFAEDPAPAPVESMDEFSPSDYAAEAAELPIELADAVARDLGISPEEYLAQGAAAVQAVEVVSSLEGAGVTVLGSRLEGTELVVNVEDGADAALVESAGGVAEYGEPAPAWDPTDLVAEPAADVYDGLGWVWSDGTYLHQCSVGYTGYLVSTGAKQFATAGHCTEDMTGTARIWTQSAPGQSGSLGATLGQKIAGTITFGNGIDVGRIDTGANVQKASAVTWGFGTGAPLSSTPRILTGDAAPIVGADVCKSGSRTGWRCGEIVDVDFETSVSGNLVNSVVTTACVMPGDSGGTGIMGSKGIGITSWVSWNSGTLPPIESRTCANVAYSGYFQMVSPGSQESVASVYGNTWEMAATVSAPTITSISGSSTDQTAINGTVANAGRNYKVDVFIDGSTTAFATATVNASSGQWSVSTTSLPAGIHSFSAVARYGTWSKSTATTGIIKRSMTVTRIDGANRFEVGVKIAQARYPSGGAPVIYVTTGNNYPDALSAAPAAAIQEGLLLLTENGGLPANVRAEIVRQAPGEIIVVGGVNSVSTAVYNDLRTIQPNIRRLGGSDRFEASRNIVADAFTGLNPSTAYIATGYNFPDALSASGAGGAFGYPVILVPGNASGVDSATLELLNSLGVTEIKIAGGPASVSNGILNSLKVIDPTPTRLSGADRFEASANIALDAFGATSPSQAYIATGYNFPDALAGAPLAGGTSSPLIVVPTTCIPAGTMSVLAQFGTSSITLLGGPASLTPDVQALRSC